MEASLHVVTWRRPDTALCLPLLAMAVRPLAVDLVEPDQYAKHPGDDQ